MVDVLHINDNNLIVQSADELFFSRGYAWLKGNDVIFDLGDGESPLSHCRLAPQEMNNRYWQQCEQSAIPANGARMRHAADLVWQHLSQLKQAKNLQKLVLVVPSHYRESNLQLLLGIAKACQLEVVGLTNKAVVALQNYRHKDGDYWHFDVQLHQTICSRISVGNGVVKLGDVEILSDVGIHLMQEALLKGLQNNFIQNDRFDPLHDAATEQQLFDQLPSIAAQLSENGKASIGLQHQGRLHNTTLDSKEWHALLKPFSDSLLKMNHSAQMSYVDLNAAFGTTGLDALSDAGVIHIVDPAPVSLDLLVQAPGSQSIIYKTELPINTRDASSSVKAAQPKATATAPSSTTTKQTVNTTAPANAATHILHAGRAVPINAAQLTTDNGVLGLKQGDAGDVQVLLDSGKLFILNDESRTQMQVNDRIGSQLADGVATVIQVL